VCESASRFLLSDGHMYYNFTSIDLYCVFILVNVKCESKNKLKISAADGHKLLFIVTLFRKALDTMDDVRSTCVHIFCR
jgi:hypothetical protein